MAWVTDDVWRRPLDMARARPTSPWWTLRRAGRALRPRGGVGDVVGRRSRASASTPRRARPATARSSSTPRRDPRRDSPTSPCGSRRWPPSTASPSAGRSRRPGRRRRPSPPTRGPMPCVTRSCGCSPPARPAIPALEALDQRGLLVRLIPEWAAVRNRPQRNAYHRFTVDRHLLEAAAQAAPLARTVARPDLLLVGCPPARHRQGLPRRPHRRRRRSWCRTWAAAWDSRPDDVDGPRGARPQPPPACRRGDPPRPRRPGHRRGRGDRRDATVAQLELLAALTEADSLATGPAAWGSWKAGLVADLVRRVATRLSGGEIRQPARPSSPTATGASCARSSAWAARSWPPTCPTSPWWRGTGPGCWPR